MDIDQIYENHVFISDDKDDSSSGSPGTRFIDEEQKNYY